MCFCLSLVNEEEEEEVEPGKLLVCLVATTELAVGERFSPTLEFKLRGFDENSWIFFTFVMTVGYFLDSFEVVVVVVLGVKVEEVEYAIFLAFLS